MPCEAVGGTYGGSSFGRPSVRAYPKPQVSASPTGGAGRYSAVAGFGGRTPKIVSLASAARSMASRASSRET